MAVAQPITSRRAMLGAFAALPLLAAPVLAGSSAPHQSAALMTAMRSHMAISQRAKLVEQEEGFWEAHNDAGYNLFVQAKALPNTAAYLPARALAIGGIVDDHDDFATLDLDELGAHAPGLAGELIRQVLACVYMGGLN